jgi:hypothetical protein
MVDARVELSSIANAATPPVLVSTALPVARCTDHWDQDGRKRWTTPH